MQSMKRPRLKDKTHARSEEWAYAFEHIEEFISMQEVVDRYSKTLDFVRRTIRGKKCGFGWSGGKESIVLADIMKQVGVTTCCFGFNSCFSYRSFIEWTKRNMPKGCEVYDHSDRVNFEVMLEKGMEAFSDDLRQYSRWINMTDRTVYPRFCEKHDLDIFIVGRRKTDNNICGKAPDYLISAKDRKWVSFSPMAEWSTEETLGYIRYFKGGYEALPPQYQYINGWHNGSDAPIYLHLEGRTRQQMWDIVYRNDPEFVHRCAKWLPSAQAYLINRV